MIDESNLKFLDDHAKAYGLNRSAMLNVILHDHEESLRKYNEEYYKDHALEAFEQVITEC